MNGKLFIQGSLLHERVSLEEGTDSRPDWKSNGDQCVKMLQARVHGIIFVDAQVSVTSDEGRGTRWRGRLNEAGGNLGVSGMTQT